MRPNLAVGVLATLACVLLPYAEGISAQAASDISVTRPPCPGCRVSLASSVLLKGDSEELSHLDGNPWMTCSSNGLFAVTSPVASSEISFFDSAARIRGKVGRRGAGPGEFRMPFPVRFGPGDSLHVFDAGNRRWTVISPDRRVVRAIPMPIHVSMALPLSNGEVIVQSAVRSDNRAGLPFHRVDTTGTIRSSFGAVVPVVRPDVEFADYRRLTKSSRGLWSAFFHEYRLEEWDLEGRLLRSLVVPTPWFPRWETRPSDKPPPPIIIDIQEDSEGYLWTIISVPDRRYRPVPAGTPMKDIPLGDHQFDTIIEVIDPRRNIVLASSRIDQNIRGFSCERTVFGYAEDAAGLPRIEAWKLSIVRP